MNKTGFRWLAAGVAAGVAAVGLLLATGCEEGKGTHALTVSPSFVDLTSSASNVTQTFTVTEGLRELSLPLKWRVSNAALGYIGSQGGVSASYVRTKAHGDNAIIVTDQYDAEGVATVRQ